MPSIPPETFASRLGGLSHGAFVELVAELWAASGWETAVDPPVVRARRNGTERRLLVLAPTRLPRLRTAPAVDGPVDAVVTPRRAAAALPRGAPDVPVITADDLHERLRHAVPAEAGERLCRAALDVPLRDERWDDDGSLLDIVGGDGESADGESAVTRRAALGALGAGAVGGGAIVAGRRFAAGDDGTDDSDDLEQLADADDVVSTPDDAADASDDDGSSEEDGVTDDDAATDQQESATDQPDASFRFTYEDGQLTITHDGGDPIPAGELSVRGKGLRVGPAYYWSRERRYDVDEPITAGDALALSADEDYAITVVWNGPAPQVVLGRDRGPAADGPDRPEQPDASVAFDLAGETLTVVYDGGEAQASHLRLRGGGFEGAPVRLWSADAGFDPDATVEPGDSVALDVDPDRVAVNVVWNADVTAEFAERPTRLGGYRGPARPLGAAGGVPTALIDPRNTGSLPEAEGPAPPLSPRWEFPILEWATVPPLVVDGVVYVASAASLVHALDARDGAELWRAAPEGSVSGGMAVAGGTVYAPTSGGVVHAFDAADGTERWRHQLNRPPGSAPTVVTGAEGGVERLFVETVTVASGSLRETVRALAPDGTERWRVGGEGALTDDTDPDRGGPPVAGDAVYTTATDATVAAYDCADGSERWRGEADVRPEGSLTVRDGTLYAAGAEGAVVAFDRTDGSVRWRTALDAGVVPAPVVTDDRLFLGSEAGTITALDRADGSEQWTTDTDLDVTEPPVVAGSRLYAVTVTGGLATVDAADGGTLSTGEPRVTHVPAVADGTLFATVNRGEAGAAVRALESR